MGKLKTVVLVLVALYLVAMLSANLLEGIKSKTGEKIVIIPVHGAITLNGEEDVPSFFGFGEARSTTILEDIKRAGEDESVLGVIFEINSPGGTVVATQEIADAVKELNKTKYALIREVGASGAYWIASATDKIIASPFSITGSIGVISSYLEFSKLFEKYGVTYERLVSGEYKDMGTSFKELTPKEREVLQKKLDRIHKFFIDEVLQNRKLTNVTKDNLDKISSGEFFLGEEAMALGLIDEFGDKEKAIELMKNELNITDIKVVTYERRESLLSVLSKISAFYAGKGFASQLINEEKEWAMDSIISEGAPANLIV